MLATSDLAQLEFAIAQARVLVTHDDDFLILHSQGVEHCGITCCQKEAKPSGYLIRLLIVLVEVATSAEIRNCMEHL